MEPFFKMKVGNGDEFDKTVVRRLCLPIIPNTCLAMMGIFL